MDSIPKWGNQIINHIEGKEKEAIDLTRQLIRIRTPNPPGDNYCQIVDFLEPIFQKLGFSIQKYSLKKIILKMGGKK